MLLKHIKYYSLLLFISFHIFLPPYSIAQGAGGAIINVNFGEGADHPGPPLPKNSTSFIYTSDSCPAPGFYTITNSFYRCPATRIGRSLDNTPSSNYGYMMLVNGTSSGKILYIDTLKEALCNGTLYQFSAWLLNAAIPANCGSASVHFPSFIFTIETTTGQILQSANTGPMPYDYNLNFVPKFHFFNVDFILPPGINDLVLKIEDDPSGYSRCGYSLAIDDIQFNAIGPQTQIAFDGAIETELVKSVCFQDNKTILMTGSSGYPELQWQQSIDNGVTWTDIAGATASNYSRVFSIPDTFLFRLTAAETVNIWNPNCRVVSNSLKIEVNGIPTDFKVTSNSPVCAGSQLSFNATGGASYIWTGPNGFYDNISYPNITFSSLTDSGMYYVNIITLGGCHSRDSTYVTMIGTDAQAGAAISICKGRSVRLKASTGVSYSWSPANGLSNTFTNSPLAKPDVTTVYTVKVTDADGCNDTAQVPIKVINSVEVKAGISGTDYFCRPYDSASFKDISEGVIISRNWDFSNGKWDTTSIPPVQYYSMSGNQNSYITRLAVIDSAGCTDTAYHTIKVVDNCYIAVPSAFTPNGDGVNDYLYPLNAYNATDLLFKVYSRSGQVVFETRDWTKKWNGTVGGVQQSTSVFAWILEYTDASNKKISLKGATVLIR